MIPVLDPIFNSLYRFHKRINLVDPSYVSLLAIVSFEWCLMVFFMQIFDTFPIKFNKLFWLVIFLILLVINYRIFLRRNKYKAIERLFNRKEKLKEKVFYDILTVLMVVFSILIAFGLFL